MTTIAKFRRHVHLAARILDTPEGRNANARQEGIDHHVHAANAILRADTRGTCEICDYLDSRAGARLAAKWRTVERRHVGLYV